MGLWESSLALGSMNLTSPIVDVIRRSSTMSRLCNLRDEYKVILCRVHRQHRPRIQACFVVSCMASRSKCFSKPGPRSWRLYLGIVRSPLLYACYKKFVIDDECHRSIESSPPTSDNSGNRAGSRQCSGRPIETCSILPVYDMAEVPKLFSSELLINVSSQESDFKVSCSALSESTKWPSGHLVVSFRYSRDG